MVFMPGYGKFRKVLLDGIYEEFYLITQLKREYELLFSFQLFLIGLKYEQMRKNIILYQQLDGLYIDGIFMCILSRFCLLYTSDAADEL